MSENVDWTKVKYFKSGEFECKCGCGFCSPHPQLVMALDMVRREYGRPIDIRSGCRCEAHNERVGGVPSSAHVTGYAVDIACDNSRDRLDLIKILPRFFSRIGVAKSFIHVDCDPALPMHVMWTY
jgi:uncharacterized protein YcbK (DUF882 family)